MTAILLQYDRLVAPAIALVLLAGWSALGYAVLTSLQRQRHIGAQILLAPTVGAGISVLVLFWLSIIGLGMQAAAAPVLLGLAAGAAALWWRTRPILPWGLTWRLALPVAGGLVLVGWPLATNGLAWLGYANNDMASYCLMAERLATRGLNEAPTVEVIAANADLAQSTWLFEVNLARPGGHLLVAWIAALVGRPAIEVYMPVLVALHGALIAVSGALVWWLPKRRGTAVLAMWLVAGSAVTTLGAVSQLLPQILGLSLGCAFLVAAWNPPIAKWRTAHAVLLGVLASSLMLAYPEFVPFVAVPIAARWILMVRQPAGALRNMTRLLTFVAVTLGLLAPYVDRFVPFFVHQAMYGTGSATGVELFPYFRLSTGAAVLWGLMPVAVPPPEPWLSVAILAGIAASFAAGAAMVALLRRAEPAAAVFFLMGVMGVGLFLRGNGFGLFKLAMYLQPFLLATVATVIGRIGRPMSWRRILPASIILVAGLPAQTFYVRSSTDATLRRTELQDQRQIVEELRRLVLVRGTTMDVDVPSILTTNLVAAYSRSVPMRLVGLPTTFRFGANPATTPSRYLGIATELTLVARSSGVPRRFSLRQSDPSSGLDFARSIRPSLGASPPPPDCEWLLATAPRQSVINRGVHTPFSPDAFQLRRCEDVHDHLAFISSTQGRHFYLSGRDPVGLFALEPDYFFRDRTMAGIGRYLLFEVVHPSATPRLILDVSASLKADGRNELPPVAIVGDTRVRLDVVGRGSGRVVSDPLQPQWIDGHAYIAIDMGVDGTRYPSARRGILGFVGRDIVIDSRRLVGVARNISLISDVDYQQLVAPASINQFPADLGNPMLEYSGIYEDGWVASAFAVRLRQPPGMAVLRLRGSLLPAPNGAPITVTVRMDDRPDIRQTLAAGAFDIALPVTAAAGHNAKISVSMSGLGRLAPPDTRPASAHLDYVGFETAR